LSSSKLGVTGWVNRILFCSCLGCGPFIGGKTGGGNVCLYICCLISNGSRSRAGIGTVLGGICPLFWGGHEEEGPRGYGSRAYRCKARKQICRSCLRSPQIASSGRCKMD
jgi:hypothetical protein